MWSRATLPADFEVGFDCGLSGSESSAYVTQEFDGSYMRGRGRPRPHNHFPNARDAGARLLVAEIVLLGSPPVVWLI
jgi:hypothetical protein